MRIGLYPHGSGSGIETYCRELAPRLSEAGHDPVAIGSVEPEAKGVDWIETPAPGTSVPLVRQRRAGQHLAAGLSKTEVDVLHLSSPPVLPFVGDHPPTITTAWFHPPTLLGGLRTAYRSYPRPLREVPLRVGQRGITQILDQWGYSAASRVVAVTSPLYNALDDRGYEATYLPPGVETNPETTWSPGGEGPAELLFVAGSVANARKNFEGLLAITRNLITEQGIDARVHVVGSSGSREERLVSDRSLSNVIELHGRIPREELFEMYAWCDCLLAPSRYEEFGYAVLEAMSHGVPIVGADIHAFRDLLGGGAGVLSTPAEPARFAADTSALLEDEDAQRQISRAALDRVEDRFDWADLIPALVRQYQAASGRQ